MSELQMLFQQLTLYLGVGGLCFLTLISLLHLCERMRMRFRLQWRRGSRANIVCFVLSAVIATVCAQKGGAPDGDANGAPPRMMARAPRITPTALDVDDLELPIVSNLCISAIEPGSNSVAFSVSWPVTMPLTSGGIDLFATWDLLHQPWFHLADVDITGATSNAVVEIVHTMFPTNAMAHTAFYLAADQRDSDQDGLSDAYEQLVSGSSPVQADSDDDGIADGEEIEFGANPNAMDSDGDGILDGDEIGFCTVMPASSTDWQLMSNGWDVWSNTSISDSGSYVVNLPCPYTVNGVVYSQIRICVDGVVYLLDPEQPKEGCMVVFWNSPSLATTYLSGCHVAIATFCTDLYVDARKWGSQAVCGSANLPSGSASVIDFYNMGFSSDVYASNRRLFSYQLVLPSGEPNTFYLTYLPIYPVSSLGATNVTIGVQCPMLSPLRSDERYYNLTWEPAGSLISGRRRVKFTIGRGTNPASADSDGDGFSDSDEIMRFQTDPNSADDDSDGDGLPDATELRIGSNPQSADSDCDGVDDCEEFLSGTDPLQPDTDNDGMNDGWEFAHDGMVVETLSQPMLLMAPSAGVVVRFDPLVNNETDSDPNNDADADPDGDGLKNAEECALGTNPCRPDTDEDGVDDHTESEQGSDPMDSSDEGLAGSRVGVTFYFGDHSGSHSEKYRLSITPVQGIGNRPSAFSWLNENYGECETKTAFLKPGWKYEVRLAHAGTKPNESVDYDYTLLQTGALPSQVVIADDDSLFGVDETSSSFAGAGKVAKITVLDAAIYADYDRDGKIDENDRAKLYAGRKLRHWVNDDDDDGDVADDSESDIPGARIGALELDGRDPDCGNDTVDGRCDLLDFAPVRLDIGGMLDQLEGGLSDYEFRLVQSAGAVKVVWTSLSTSEAGTFLTENVTGCGRSLNQNASEARVAGSEDDGAAIPIPTSVINLIRNDHDKGVMLIEGCAETTSPLVFECRRASDDELVFKVEMPLSISGVEKMYRTCSLRGATDDPGLSVLVPAAPENSAEEEKDLDVFFLHGFNVNAECARAWGSEIFKRLWQSGSNARFHILPWHGDYSWSPGDMFNGLHYQHNVWFAQRTAGALRRYIEAAQSDSSKRILMTHSLGNMVVCEALREGLQVGKYFMFDAALPSEAIDGTLRAEESSDDTYTKYVRPEWRDYTNVCWASNWHRLFAGEPNDARGRMSWVNRFQDALTNATEVFNYYSSGDSIFTEQDGIPSLGSDVHVNWGLNWFLWVIPYPTVEFTFENHCWQKQEVLKGMATLAGTLSGGWGFNVWQEYDILAQGWKSVSYSPAGAAVAIADGSITNRPVFDVSDADEMMNPNATEDDIFLALAKHVPALSSPVGGTNVIADCMSENVNMNLSDAEGGVSRPNGWGRMHPNYGVSWLHSDMKDMAFFYVYQLYDQLIMKGNLR